MNGLVADSNIVGHLRRLVGLLENSIVAAEWSGLKLSLDTVATLGFDEDVDDRTLWNHCQQHQLVLVTANRNSDGDNSLGVALAGGTEDSLPVITLADSERILADARYAEHVAFELFDRLEDIRQRPEAILGSGRVYLPSKPFA